MKIKKVLNCESVSRGEATGKSANTTKLTVESNAKPTM
jgi:hypothetical protein